MFLIRSKMKELWDKLSQAISDYNSLSEEFQQGLSEPRTIKANKKLLEKWNYVVRLHNEYDRVVEPIQPIEVKMPFKGEEFLETWTMYKEYLIENYQRYLGSRQEMIVLKYVKKYSKNNVSKAIAILEFHILHNYKGLFPISDKQLTGEEPLKDVDSSDQTDVLQTPKKKL